MGSCATTSSHTCAFSSSCSAAPACRATLVMQLMSTTATSPTEPLKLAPIWDERRQFGSQVVSRPSQQGSCEDHDHHGPLDTPLVDQTHACNAVNQQAVHQHQRPLYARSALAKQHAEGGQGEASHHIELCRAVQSSSSCAAAPTSLACSAPARRYDASDFEYVLMASWRAEQSHELGTVGAFEKYKRV